MTGIVNQIHNYVMAYRIMCVTGWGPSGSWAGQGSGCQCIGGGFSSHHGKSCRYAAAGLEACQEGILIVRIFSSGGTLGHCWRGLSWLLATGFRGSHLGLVLLVFLTAGCQPVQLCFPFSLLPGGFYPLPPLALWATACSCWHLASVIEDASMAKFWQVAAWAPSWIHWWALSLVAA